MEKKLDRIIELLEELNTNVKSLVKDNGLDDKAIEMLKGFHEASGFEETFEEWLLLRTSNNQ